MATETVEKAATKKRKPRRKKHPGVVILKPEPERRIGWRLRYTDPDSGRMVKEAIPEAEARRADTREDCAVRKYQWIARRKIELEQGAVRKTGTKLADAFVYYFKHHPNLRDSTRDAYKDGANAFIEWTAKHGITSCDSLTRKTLGDWKASRVAVPKKTAQPGGKKGQRKATAERRSAWAVNRELRAVKTVLRYLEKQQLLPKLSLDDITRGLELERIDHDAPERLQASQLRALLRAALDHDSVVFAETRAEHAGKGERGTTPRYPAIATFTALMVLSGMRLDEAVSLRWEQVDLEALGHDGEPVGEIRLRASEVKTHKGRTVGLEVSPMLRQILLALRPDDAGGEVFPDITYDYAQSARRRLIKEFGAPKNATWKILRATCGTYLTCSPGIFGAASAFLSAKQLGHSVQVAEKHYVGQLRGISREARTLEAAMGIEGELGRVLDEVRGEDLPANVVPIGVGR